MNRRALHRRSHYRFCLSLAAVVASVAACVGRGEEGPSASLATVTDSAGVRVVVNRVPDGGFPVCATLTEAPSLLLGGTDPDARPVGAVTLPDGRIAVGDAGTASVRFHAAGGDLIGSVGGEGDGPGPLQSVSRIGHVAGDTVWVADQRDAHLVLVTPAGVSDRWEFPQGLSIAGRFADDGYLVVPQWTPSLLEEGWAEGVRRDSASWGVWWPRAVAASQLPHFPHDELMVLRGGDGPLAAVPPFGRRTSRVVGPDAFWVGDQVAFEIRRYRPDGALTAILRLEGVDLTLSQALKESVRPPRSEGDTALVDRLWKGAPQTRPAYTRFVLDASGNLWIAEHVAGTQPPRTWLVFSPDGVALGAVTMPDGFEPLEIGVAHVLGVQGPPGRRSVARYGLVRATGARGR